MNKGIVTGFVIGAVTGLSYAGYRFYKKKFMNSEEFKDVDCKDIEKIDTKYVDITDIVEERRNSITIEPEVADEEVIFTTKAAAMKSIKDNSLKGMVPVKLGDKKWVVRDEEKSNG